MRSVLRIAMAQINSTVGDLGGNRAKIVEYMNRAKKLEADIVLFPELALCGYPPEDLLLKKHFVRDNMKVLRTMVKESLGITAIVGCVDIDKRGNVYNAAAVLHNGKLKGIYHKINLPNYSVFDEKRYFAAGKKSYIFSLGSVCFGVTICEDIWDEQGNYREQVMRGAQVLMNISASPFHAGKRNIRERMLKERARKSKTHICYLNLVGGQDELVFDGGSFVLDNKGRKVAASKFFDEDLRCVDIPLSSLARRTIKTSRRVSLITLPSRMRDKKRKKIEQRMVKPPSPLAEIYQALVLGTHDYVIKNGFKKVVLGLSGGIDSALTATIACDAIGKENVIAVAMPSTYSSQETRNDTKRLAHNLDIRLITVPIEDIYEMYMRVLRTGFKGKGADETEENIQARIRGNILMAFSNKFGWLVLTTGNKSETAVGYCTLYGDMAGGFAVIKDVSKLYVYRLVAHRNAISKRGIIPKSIIERPPSAELRPNQKDQDSLPPYSLLDVILKDYIEADKSFEEIVSRKGRQSIVRDVIKKVDRNEYKRRQAPPGIKITPKSFGKDRRLPITNRYIPL